MSDSYFDLLRDTLSETKDNVSQNIAEKRAQEGTIAERIKNSRLFKYKGNYNDMIEVEAGTKTLIGEDFATLYESCGLETIQTQLPDGTASSVTVLKPTCSYQTEMHSGNLVMGQWSEYATVPVNKQAAYEVALLTKKYAAMEDTEANAQEYADKMARYRQVCEAEGINWDTVIFEVSGEFQTEAADYKSLSEDKSNFYDKITLSSAKARAQAADAHNMLMQCTPEGYQMQILPALVGKITESDITDAAYDDSTSAKGVGFLAAVNAAFTCIYEKLPHPIEWVKTVFSNMKTLGQDFAENTRALMDNFEAQSEAGQQEMQEMYDQFNGMKEDIIETAPGQAAQKAADAVTDEIDQIFEDPSQEMQDARDWMGEASQKAEPYVNAVGNALDAVGENVKERADEFVDKWADSEYKEDASDEYQAQ